MQLNLYIFNQLFRTCMALITVLIGIIWLFQSIRLLEFVVDKGASVGEFFAMSVASMPLWLMITVPISGFIAVNWVFNRILSDRELTVMQAVGLSPFQLTKAPIALGLMLSAFLAINSVYILPNSSPIDFHKGLPIILLILKYNSSLFSFLSNILFLLII